MKRYIALFVVMIPLTAYASDQGMILKGKALHDAKCMACHGTEVYSRDDHKMQSLEELSQRVKFCLKNAVRENWTDAQITSVVDYLNKTFYKF